MYANYVHEVLLRKASVENYSLMMKSIKVMCRTEVFIGISYLNFVEDSDGENEIAESHSGFMTQKQVVKISDNPNSHLHKDSYSGVTNFTKYNSENSDTGDNANPVEKTLDGERSYQNFRNGRKVHAPLAVLVNRSNTSSLSGSLTTMQYVSNAIKGNKSNVEQVLTTLENSLDLSENLCQKAILTQILDHSGKPNVRRSWDSSSNKTNATQECEDLKYGEATQSLLLDPTRNLEEFIMKPAPQGVTIRCRITRDKRGVDRGIFPSYYLHLEKEDCKFFLLAARRRKRSTTSNYVISCDATNLSRDAISFAGKLRSNFLGTHFTVYGCESKSRDSKSLNSGDKVNDSGSITTTTKTHNMLELAAIIYDTTWLIDSWRRKDMQNVLQLQNKNPVWNEDEYILMQFGRISEDVFTMDYTYPMCALQAFGIALSSFDSKLACE
uniref:Tubby protein-like protein n=1 Tax=Schistosoma haematobium TaxID=6185 RepID=A0A095A3Q0_SCHHA